MNINMYLAFLKWCFMKMFGGTFNALAAYRKELKRGAPNSIFATVGFSLISFISVGASMLIAACFTESTQVVKLVGSSVFWLAVVALVYNIFKAAFECFQKERRDLLQTLKGSNDSTH